MYRITEEVKAYYSIYEFVSEINKGEAKRYDAFTWFYREKEDDTAEEAFRLYNHEYRVIQDQAMILLTLALEGFRLIGLKEADVLSEEMLEFMQ